MNGFRPYWELLAAANSRTLSGAFTSFLDREIGITGGTRTRASGSQDSIREYLRDITDRDEAFPRILRVADKDFLGGSFSRHTKIWPLNDIDVYVPIDGMGLVYIRGGNVAPYSVLTDGVLSENPLTVGHERWWNGSNISSKKLIDGFATVLRKKYPATTRIRRGGEAVSVTLANDLGFDVVPCFSLTPQYQSEQSFYLIPDGSDGWIQTNPRLDQSLSERLHKDNYRTLRRGVKLVKWWTNEYIGNRVASYYSELAIMRAFETFNLRGHVISEISHAAMISFRALRDALQSGDQSPILQGAPMVQPGEVTAPDRQLLDQQIVKCEQAVLHELNGQVSDALALWIEVFGDKFQNN